MTLGKAPHPHAQETQNDGNLNKQSLAMGQPFSSVGGWDGGELVEAKTRDPNRCETPSHPTPFSCSSNRKSAWLEEDTHNSNLP